MQLTDFFFHRDKGKKKPTVEKGSALRTSPRMRSLREQLDNRIFLGRSLLLSVVFLSCPVCLFPSTSLFLPSGKFLEPVILMEVAATSGSEVRSWHSRGFLISLLSADQSTSLSPGAAWGT